jgi:succinate dehydrogenase / fumarate reductase iron-sulfur subunit
MMKDSHSITLHIKRYDPDTQKKWTQTYQLEVGRILRFTDVFRKLNNEVDPTLAWNSSCEHAQCGTCAVKVNGKPLLACELLVENAVTHFKTTAFTIEPISVAPVVRDLVVDLEKAYARVHKVKPYIIRSAPKQNTSREYQIFPRMQESYLEATRCINCFCCASACISTHRGFLGPNAMLASIVRLMDPREAAKKERMALLFSEEGVYRCHTSKACSFVCPKEIDVAHFIALAKEGRILKEE